MVNFIFIQSTNQRKQPEREIDMIAVTKFSGGGGVDIGMEAAGWEHAYGIEYDDKIASVARSNGLNTITADILKIKPSDYHGMDWMHDSPPCPNFSTAKANAEETVNDLALAQAVCDWIVYHRPRFYTLENVYGYRKSKSWAMIADTLNRHGYSFNYWHVNMADYGVPQTRKRMIVIARLDGKTPHLPKKTHDENPVPGLFGTLKRWVSWYEAMGNFQDRDEVGLPQWAEYIKPKIKSGIYAMMPNSTGYDRNYEGKGIIEAWQPAATFTSNSMDKVFYCNGERNYKPKSIDVARFQSFPDWYELPESNTLAARIIGNAVPPLFMQRVGEMFKESITGNRADKR